MAIKNRYRYKIWMTNLSYQYIDNRFPSLPVADRVFLKWFKMDISCSIHTFFLSPLLSFCSYSARAYQVKTESLFYSTSPLFPSPHIAYTHTYSPQRCQGGLISLLPALTSPASSPQTLEAVLSELWRLTSPVSTWDPEVTCSPVSPGTPSCPARCHSHQRHL